MKILITAPSLDVKNNVSGISSVVNNILSLSDMEYIHFLVGKKDQQKRDVIWIFNQFLLPIKLMLVFLSNKIDIFHLNAPLDKLAVTRDFVLLLTAKLFQIKVVMHLHGGEYLKNIPENKFFFKYLNFYFNRANHIIVLSQIEKEWLLNNYNIVEDNVTALENCVLIPQNIEKKDKEKVRIIFIGRIVERKGIFDIVEALLKLDKKRTDFEFYLYGIGPQEDVVIKQLSVMKNNKFEFKGVVSGNSKIDAYTNADIFLLPSHFGEGLPMGLLEAMSYGVVPVVTDDGSMSAVINNGENGYIVDKHNDVVLTNVIEGILERFSDKSISKIRDNAMQTIEENYNCKFYSNKLEEIYRSLVVEEF